ncbi:MAG: D-amino acid dehydrogenase [Betaproteobacteria bacterium]|nr:D-amino acid dehydrogenase [Betaproteobacteria bacterium]
MTVLVLGAGVIGVTTAWYLRAQGHDVRVIERREGAALESSFANAGQVSAHLAEPWSNPSTLRQLPRWLLQDGAPLVWRPRWRFDQWRWLAKFLRECSPARYSRNLLHLAAISLYSRETLRALRAETGIGYDFHEGGILLFHTDPQAFGKAAATARRLQAHGLKRTVLDVDECIATEPALAHLRDRLAGGIYSRHDETGDAHQFTQALARLGTERGIRFDYGSTVRRLLLENGEVKGAEVDHADGRRESIAARCTVVCLGPHTPALVKPVGVDLDIYPVKGYSITLPVADEKAALRIGVTDAAAKIAFSRLGDRIRATSTAEIADFDLTVDRKRCEALVRHTLELFPGAGDAGRAEFWAGLRPTTPSNLPCVGRSKVPGLFLNAGHGTVGWTQSCGSGRAIAEIVAGRRPGVDFPFLGVA